MQLMTAAQPSVVRNPDLRERVDVRRDDDVTLSWSADVLFFMVLSDSCFTQEGSHTLQAGSLAYLSAF